jgi:Domain of unknown function (DUF222)
MATTAAMLDQPLHAPLGVEAEAALLDRIRELEALKARAAAEQARATARLHALRGRREALEGVDPRDRCRGLGTEVALARGCSPHRGNQHVGVALALVRELPQTLDALDAGRISEWVATMVVRETAVLTSEHRAEADRQVAARCGDGLGERQLIAEARRCADRLDPGAAVRRRAHAQSERRISVRPAPDTMTWLTGLLPVADGVACKVALERTADRLRARGDARTRGQIMADVLVERVTGRTTAQGPSVEIALLMTDQSLWGDSGEPARLVGHGPIPADHARSMVRDAARAWVRRLYTRPGSGDLVAMDSRRRCFAGQLRHLLVLTDDTRRTPGCDAPARHLDHVEPVKRGGRTGAANAAGLCEACNYTKDLPGWSASLITTSDGARILELRTPTGQRHRGRAPDPPGAPDRLRPALGLDLADYRSPVLLA